MQEFIIERNDAGQRLDKYLFKLMPNAEHSLIYKQLRNKNIVCNGAKCKGSETLQEEDRIKIFMADDTIAKFRGAEQAVNHRKSMKNPLDLSKFDILYEDEHIIVVNKPHGILSQKAEPSDISMNEYLEAYLESKDYQAGLTFKPSFCNRLDRNTTGLLLGGISLKGSQVLSEVLKDRSLRKYYLTIVLGHLTDTMKLDGYLYKNEKTNKVQIYPMNGNHPKDAVEIHTEYESIAYNSEKNLTLCRIHLITGKTHQIRAHLASIGHPILGDMKYGYASRNHEHHESTQILHAYEVRFPNSVRELNHLNGKQINAPIPVRIKKYFPNYNPMI